MTTQLPPRSELGARWSLSPDVVFLNHGSFGATPRVVQDAQSALRARMEAEPVRFMLRDLEPLLDASREALAAFVGCSPAGLAFVSNATSGVNTVLRSLELSPGDELVTTDHEYNACKNALDFVAQRAGAKVIVARVPFPVASERQVVDAVLEALTPRTKLLLIDHVTSPTALVMPVEAIVKGARERGVDTLVDGAHAPGMVPLALDHLGAAYYTANCHKWICAPKGAAMLHVREDRREAVRPLAISHGANSPRQDRSRFRLEMDWTGTRDPTAALCVRDALTFMGGLAPGGFAEVMRRNRELALSAKRLLERALGAAPLAPDSMIGSMAAVALPDRRGPGPTLPSLVEPLQDALYDRHNIQVPIVPWPAPPRRLVRVSAQAYDSLAEYSYLADALREELTREP